MAKMSNALSELRFATYLDACGGDFTRAEALYVVNMRLSGAALESLHMFEVVLRNAIDHRLRDWNREHGGGELWALTPVPMLQGLLDARGKLSAAQANAARAIRSKNRPLRHDDVVAHLSLGTWRHILPSQRHPLKQMLWDEALVEAFPLLYDITPSVLVEWIAMAYDLRNRVAHFEPIFSRDLFARRRAMYRTMKTVGREAQAWFGSHDRFHGAVEEFYREWPEHKGNKA